MRIAFVTNICSHYRVKTFETFARYYDVDYYFFSAGDEWYWQQEHGVRVGNFHYEYLPGFHLGRTRITPTLPWKLWKGNYDVYIKCINGRFALPITYLVARLRRKPFILWTGIWSRLETPVHRLLFPFTRYIYRHADAIVVYGEHVKRYLISEGVSPQCIFVAAHAVDNETYNRQVSEEEKAALRRKLNIAKEQKIVLYLGRLEEVKGLPYLLEAFASLQRKDAVLVLAGTGSERVRLEQLAREKNLTEQVRFAGYMPPEETLPYYAIAYVFVLPSVTMPYFKEPWGLVVNEAMNQGVPVIATDAVGAAAGGLVQDGVNGFVVPERDSDALAQALKRILDDPDLRTRFGQNARRIIPEWDNERMVLGFRQAVEYVLERRETLNKLHLGCFDQVLAGWINTDITPHIWISRVPSLATLLFRLGIISQERMEQHRQGIFRKVKYLNCTRRFPYPDNTFEYVYMSHLLEHLYPDQAISCLREVHRVLKPGGILRIAVPDLDKIVAYYDPSHPETFLESLFEARQKRDKNKHHWHYNESSLRRILVQIGFQDVYRCEYSKGQCADVEIVDNRPDSLFIEAVK